MRILLLTLLAALALPLVAPPEACADPYLLRNRYEGSERWILTWQFSTTLTSSGNETAIEAEGREAVTVKPLGDGRLLYRALGERCLIKGADGNLTPAQISMLGPGAIFEAEIDGMGRTLRVIRQPELERGYPFLFVFPEAPVGRNAPWTGRDVVPVPKLGNLEIDTRLTIAEAVGDELRLSGKTAMRWTRDRREGRTESRLTYDRKAGVLLRGRMRTNLEVDIKGIRFDQSLFFNWDLRPDVAAPAAADGGW